MEHGDHAVVECRGELYEGTIERRMIGQWPCKDEALFFVRPLYFPWMIKDGQTDIGPVRIVR